MSTAQKNRSAKVKEVSISIYFIYLFISVIVFKKDLDKSKQIRKISHLRIIEKGKFFFFFYYLSIKW